MNGCEKAVLATEDLPSPDATWTAKRHAEFMARDLSRVGAVALFVDGAASPRAMLCAWTLTWAGERELLALTPGLKSSPSDCAALLQDLRDRGLPTPVIVVADGDSHLLHAAAREFPMAPQQRCLRAHHRHEEELAPEGPMLVRARRAMRAAHEAPSASLAGSLRRDVVQHHCRALPSLTTWFDVTFEACTAYLALPRPLHRLARTTHVEEMLASAERGSLAATCGALHDALAACPAIAFLDTGREPLRAAG
jgi:transposase-like protein